MADVIHNETQNHKEESLKDAGRRKFFVRASVCAAVGGMAALGVPFVKSLAPDDGAIAVGSTEVDLSKIEKGKTQVVVWRGRPVFVRHRTPEEIKTAQEVELNSLRDPQVDKERVKEGKEEWLVVVGVCTHLGCVPESGKGDFGGWFCPCHGSHYDVSGRIRKGPAPQNLAVPEYQFLSDTTIKIG